MKTFSSEEGYNLYAADYKKDHPHLDSFDWDTSRLWIIAALESLLVASPDAVVRVLDLGCGDGRVLKRLVRICEQKGWTERVELEGWDISEGMLKQARKALPPSVVLHQRDIFEISDSPDAGPKATQAFDLVLSFFVLVHIDPPSQFVRVLEALLKPGGRAIFNNIPQRDALVLESGGKKFQIEFEHHSPDEVRKAIDESSLRLAEYQSGTWSDLFSVEK